MKVIVAGFSRTGTMSMQVALQSLGYETYHMFEALGNFEKGHMDMWNDYMEGAGEMDWQGIFSGYDASTDLPACIHWREMIEAFPDAKVVLTFRDPEAWWNSYMSLVQSQESGVDRLSFLPRFKALDRLVINIEKIFFGIEPGQYDRTSGIERFNQHNEDVKNTVPPERLLVFNVEEGWAPLCKFLGVDTPDQPFPHENVGTQQVEKIMGQLVIKDMLKFVLPYLVAVVAVIIIILLILRT
jgi:hypothetical protein